MRIRRALAAVGAAVLLASTAACAGDTLDDSGSEDAGASGTLTVGSASFTEGQIMAELYKQLLEDAGYTVEVSTVTGREIYAPELESGDIDIVPEYAASLTEYYNLQENGPDAAPIASPDVEETITALEPLAEAAGIVLLEPSEAVDQNAFVVTQEFADANSLTTLTDLGALGQPIRLAAGDDCATRPFCQPGLESTYGIQISAIDPLGVASLDTKQSVQNGTNQLGLVVSTDGSLEDFGLVILEDDKNLQLADNLVPAVNAESAADENIAEALNPLAPVLTTEDLTTLNRRVDSERELPADVARSYLEEKGLLGS